MQVDEEPQGPKEVDPLEENHMHRLKLFEIGEEKMSLKEATEKQIPINTF